MNAVAVFCGSSVGNNPAFAAAARDVGRLLATSGQRVIFGGGCVGLMGVLADATLEAGGQAIGVIPQALVDKEVAHRGLTQQHIVRSMHERKALMADLADAFIALPGGVGTLEEFFEIWTWAQLGLHAKPFGLLDVAGFYQPLLAFLNQVVAQGFVRPRHRELLLVDDDPARLVTKLADVQPNAEPKWITPEES